MKLVIRLLVLNVLFIALGESLHAQQTTTVYIIDKITREPIGGATVQTASGKTYVANEKGELVVTYTDGNVTITMVGYIPIETGIKPGRSFTVPLEQQSGSMQQVIVT